MTGSALESYTYDHVIVGAGIAADKAARAIRELNPEATMLIIGADSDPPVYRPALSKDLWLKADATVEGQFLSTEDSGAELMVGVSVTVIDSASHTLETSSGQSITYGKLLLAMGAAPRFFDGAPEDPRILYYRTAADYRQLREQLGPDPTVKQVAVVGGGYIASELAAGLLTAGAKVTVYFPGKQLLEHMLPADIADHVAKVYRARGVTTVSGFRLHSINVLGEKLRLTASDGHTDDADLVVLGLGAAPNVALAESLGLEMSQGGVQVNAHLNTSMKDIYAAGDIATFEDPLLGARRVEHVDMAEKSGTAAGRNMAGEPTEFHYTPFFFSDLFDDGYEAVGELRSNYRTLSIWNESHSAAVVYYLHDNCVRGILLWNTWGQLARAREVISESRTRTYGDDELKGLIKPGE